VEVILSPLAEKKLPILKCYRQFNSALYERLVLSRDKKGIKELSEKGQIIDNAKDSLNPDYSPMPVPTHRGNFAK
jgi:hypothetical protein